MLLVAFAFGSARDAWGTKPVLDVTLAHRPGALEGCGVDAVRILAVGRRVAREADAVRRHGDTLLRERDTVGFVRSIHGHNHSLAVLAAEEAAEVERIVGERLPCVLDVLDAWWAVDRVRGEPVVGGHRRGSVTVTYEVFATQYDANTADEVAIPDYCIKFANLGWETCSAGYANPDYDVEIARGSYQDTVWVGDVGPWNIDDNYWNAASDPDRPRRLFGDLPQGYNEARAAYYDDYNGGLDQYGRTVGNPAGLDLAVEMADNLGLAYLENDWVDLTFPWESYDTSPSLSMAIAQDPRVDQPVDTRGGDGVFDAYPTQTWPVRVVVSNGGSERAGNVIVGVEAEAPWLDVARWDAYTDAPAHDGATWVALADEATNPTHDDPGATFTLAISSLEPGESRLLVFEARALAESIGVADHPDLRAWVGHVDNYYEKADFWATPTNVSGSQTWNGGDLRVYAQHDVWPSQTRWTFEDGTAEGWFAGGSATVAGGTALSIEPTGDDPQAISSFFVWTAGADEVVFDLTSAGGEGRIYWALDGGTFDEAHSTAFSAPAGAGPLAVPVAWSGVVTRIRIDPPAGAAMLDNVGLVGTGGEDDTGGTPVARVERQEPTGCGCGSGGAPWAAGALLAVVGISRRAGSRGSAALRAG